MVRCYLGHSVGWRARLNAYLYSMFAALDEDRSARYLSKHHVSMIRARMAQLEGNLSSEISIAALAADCGICKTSFRRVFRDIYGLSPKQYIQSVRFRQARALLDGSNLRSRTSPKRAGLKTSIISPALSARTKGSARQNTAAGARSVRRTARP